MDAGCATRLAMNGSCGLHSAPQLHIPDWPSAFGHAFTERFPHMAHCRGRSDMRGRAIANPFIPLSIFSMALIYCFSKKSAFFGA
jgi:hypothetical protein